MAALAVYKKASTFERNARTVAKRSNILLLNAGTKRLSIKVPMDLKFVASFVTNILSLSKSVVIEI
jgi:hypothetical protein